MRDTTTQDDDALIADPTADQVKRLLAGVDEAAEFTGGIADLRMINGESHVILYGLTRSSAGLEVKSRDVV